MKIKARQVLHLERAALRELIVQGLKERGFETTGAVKVDFVADSEGEVAVLVENMRPPEEEKPQKPGRGRRKFKAKISNERVAEVVRQVLFREGLESGEQLIAESAVEILSDHGEIPRDADLRQEQRKLVPRVRKALEELRDDGEAELVEEGEEMYWTAVRGRHKRQKKGAVCRAVCQRESVDFVTKEGLPKGATCVWVTGVGITATPLEDWPEGLWEELDMLESDRRVFAEVLGRKEQSESDVAADILGGEGGVMGRGDALENGLGE